MQTIITKQNQYRQMRTDFINFEPYNIDIHNLEFESLMKENGASNQKCVHIHCFESITLMSVSSKGYYHCAAFTGKDLKMVVLKNKRT